MTSNRTLTTWATRLGSLAVAGVAGYASYSHIRRVAVMAGETAEVAAMLPLAIDGLIVVGTMAMLADKADGRAPRLSARMALGFGVVATLAANIASAQPTLLARLVAAAPAAAFLLAVEVLARRGKLLPAEDVAGTEAAETADGEVARPAKRRPAVTRARLSAADRAEAVLGRFPGLTTKQLAAKANVSERTARRAKSQRDAGSATAEPRTAGRLAGMFEMPEGAIA
jgi:hypothetical protein